MHELIHMISQILDIPVPPVSNDTTVFSSPTQLGATDGRTLYLNPSYNDKYDMYFTIAHEMRHIWQMRHSRMEWSRTKEHLSKDDYNSTEAELDANAFAVVILLSLFRRKPLFNGLSEQVKHKIYCRAEELAKIYCQT